MAVDHALMDFDDPEPFGFPPFDRLTGNSRLALLAPVGSTTLREDIPRPELNSLTELTVAVVFDEILTGVDLEIDSPEVGGEEGSQGRST